MYIIAIRKTSIISKKINKNPIHINEVNTNKIVLSNKTPYGEKGANKYYIRYVGSTGFRPLHIIIKKNKILY